MESWIAPFVTKATHEPVSFPQRTSSRLCGALSPPSHSDRSNRQPPHLRSGCLLRPSVCCCRGGLRTRPSVRACVIVTLFPQPRPSVVVVVEAIRQRRRRWRRRWRRGGGSCATHAVANPWRPRAVHDGAGEGGSGGRLHVALALVRPIARRQHQIGCLVSRGHAGMDALYGYRSRGLGS
eukprot:COSAG01_NODE_2482_length_7600_cov_16.178110_6_plen_180_part_00